MILESFDLETHLIQPGLLAPPIVVGAWSCDGCSELHTPGKEFDARVFTMLQQREIICGANIAYDFGCLVARDPTLLPMIFKLYDEERVFDVLIAQTLDAIYHGLLQDGGILHPNGSILKHPVTGTQVFRYSLDIVTWLNLGRTNAKEHDTYRARYASLEHLPLDQWPEEARQYPIDDVENTLLVAEAQIGSCKNLHDMPNQADAAFCEHLGAMWGIRTDGKTVKELGEELRARSKAEIEKFTAQGFYRLEKKKGVMVPVANSKVIQQRVSAAYNGSPPMTEPSKKFPEGQISTARETLEDSGDPVLEEFAEVSRTKKLVSTYLPFVEAGVAAPINIKPNVLLNTGRSSYEGLIQLLPRKGKVRECFVARPGTVWCSVDYAAIELSTLAQVCLWVVGESRLAEAINNDLDPHSLLGGMLVNMPYQEFLSRVKAEEPVIQDRRTAAKAGNFGFPGGMGAAKFVLAKRKEGLRVCELMGRNEEPCGTERVTEWRGRPTPPTCQQCAEAAEEIRRFYFAQWLEMRAYHDYINSSLQTDDHLEQFVSKRVRGGLTFTSGANTLFQGLAADGAKRALRAVTRECYLPGTALYGCRVVIFSHDELILEMPEERAHEASLRQAHLMVEKMKEVVPDVQVKAEPALMRRWYKNAKAVYRDGRLVPWEPLEEKP